MCSTILNLYPVPHKSAEKDSTQTAHIFDKKRDRESSVRTVGTSFFLEKGIDLVPKIPCSTIRPPGLLILSGTLRYFETTFHVSTISCSHSIHTRFFLQAIRQNPRECFSAEVFISCGVGVDGGSGSRGRSGSGRGGGGSGGRGSRRSCSRVRIRRLELTTSLTKIEPSVMRVSFTLA